MLSGALDFIVYAFTVTTNAISAAASWWWTNIVIPAWNWIQAAETTIDGWINNAWNWFWANVVAPAIQLVSDALNWGLGVLQYAIDLAAQGLDWLVNNIIDPVWQWIQNAASTVAGWVNGWWDWIWANVVGPLIGDAEYWAHLLASAWHWLTTTVVAAVNIVIAAWDWLVWFGEHTFSDLGALLSSSGPHDVYEFILGQASQSNSWVESFIDALAKEME